jgi:hypothetical protein
MEMRPHWLISRTENQTEKWSPQIKNEKTKRRDKLRFFKKNPT